MEANVTDLASPSPNVCALLTPVGRGAVATVGVRGPGAGEIVGRRFSPASGKRLAAFEPGRVLFGRFQASLQHAEELVVGLIAAGEIEIHCHGGVAAAKAVALALVAEGCQQASAAQWAQLSEPDAIRAAALVALSAARTERTAAILLDQYRGALSEELARIAAALQTDDTAAASDAIDGLLGRRNLGLHLTTPWQVALVGRPNVGKSSLINALLGYQRAIVFDQPGTTRDVLTAATAFDGWPVELADTAGLQTGGDAIEAEGVLRARQQLATADVALFVVDSTLPWTAADNALAASLPAAALVVHNKCDLATPPADGRPAGLAISAKTGEGLDQLIRAIALRLVPELPPPGAPVPFTGHQFDVLQQAGRDLNAGAAERALAIIAALLHARNIAIDHPPR